jgi:hypothetical protein
MIARAVLLALALAGCTASAVDPAPGRDDAAPPSAGTCSALIGVYPWCDIGAHVHCTACPLGADYPADVSPVCVMATGDEDAGNAAFWCVNDDGGAA